MQLSVFFRINLVRFFSLFCFSKKSKVIFYHDIHSSNKYTDMSTSLDLFKKHINIIKDSGYEIVSEITKEYGQIEICFDDGFLGLYENIEFFKQENIFVHLFVVSSFLELDGRINLNQLLELNNLDIITISSHTHTHKILTDIEKDEIERELQESKINLERLLNTPIHAICFPEGKFNNEIIHIAEEVGYKKQYSSFQGFFFNKFKPKLVRRSLEKFDQ